MKEFQKITLTAEQQGFIDKAKTGANILVDACIGSGKTTTIQRLCCELPQEMNVLYLTYNRLLKVDAKTKIKSRNTTVTNYHGYAYSVLFRAGISCGISDTIQRFISEKPTLKKFDVLILDEYQDIDQEISEMLLYIRSTNPQMQIIAVGDMEQKIYDKTALNVSAFINELLGDHIELEFTSCFRISSELATKLGRIWGKTIVGINDHCIVEEMSMDEAVGFLSVQEPSDILCLGKRNGKLTNALNLLENNFPDKFNKKTVYASIRDEDGGGATNPSPKDAIFTTYDSSKGLERKVCVVFDFTEKYWSDRSQYPQQSYEILRNIFCVAASRGKDRIIFVNSGEKMLSEEMLSNRFTMNNCFDGMDISSMFDFKYKEDVEQCYNLINTTRLNTDTNSESIKVRNSDGLIDLSPCIGIYQEAVYFNKYDIDKAIEFCVLQTRNSAVIRDLSTYSLDQKILYLVSMETKQRRYKSQVTVPFVSEDEKEKIVTRLSALFSKDENVQVKCSIDFRGKEGKTLFSAIGMADVVRNKTVYELKFVAELKHEHFLQCACYAVAMGLENGVLWNVYNNTMYEITIPDTKTFLDMVAKTITKGYLEQYYGSKEVMQMETTGKEKKVSTKAFAVIDTETNFDNQVMSIGVVIADANDFHPICKKYYILSPECLRGGMYFSALILRGINPIKCTRKQAIADIICDLKQQGVLKLYAYNSSFDQNLLPELASYDWHDIIQFAAYKQYNPKIPGDAECYGTGRLKRNYGVESIMRLLSGNRGYFETHNAILDALDELKIMELLAYPPDQYKSSKTMGSKSNSSSRSNSTKSTSRGDNFQTPNIGKAEKTIEVSNEIKGTSRINNDTLEEAVENTPKITHDKEETCMKQKKSKSTLEKFFDMIGDFFKNL